MRTVEDRVREVVTDFMKNSSLFTALDVSNEVKLTHPLARHREVRDVVRGLSSEMTAEGYNKTPIKVTLSDGSQVEALLYHHLSDSWDLDSKYDTAKRQQTPAVVAPVVPVPPVTIVSSVPVAVAAPAVTVPAATQVTVADPKALWNNLFNGIKLFP